MAPRVPRPCALVTALCLAACVPIVDRDPDDPTSALGASHDRRPATCSACPAGWVQLAGGGCGPAFRVCPMRLAREVDCACANLRAPSDARHPWAGVREGVDAPFPVSPTEVGVGRCPADWRASPDGDCDPAMPDTCPAGAAALPGGRCTATGVDVCGADPWPDLSHETAGRTVHVRAGAAGGDGSAARPWGSLDAAMRVARSGDRVALADGTYSADHVAWPDGVSVFGHCAARVIVRATATVRLPRGVTLGGVTVDGAGVSVDTPGARRMQRVVLRNGADGVVVTGRGASLRAEELWVHDVTAGPAMRVADGAQATLEATAFRDARAAVTVSGAQSSLAARQLASDRGVDVSAQATVALHESALRGVVDGAVRARGASAILDGVRIEAEGATGFALRVEAGAHLDARRVSLRGAAQAISARGGAFAFDALDLRGCAECLDVVGADDGERPRNTIQRARIAGRDGFTMRVRSARLELGGSDVITAPPVSRGGVLEAFGGAAVEVFSTRFHQLGAGGVRARDAGTTLLWSKGVLDGRGHPDADGALLASMGAVVNVRASLATDLGGTAYAAHDRGTRLTVEDGLVRDLAPSSAGVFAGVLALDGAQVDVTRTQLRGAGSTALGARGVGAVMNLRDVDVEGVEGSRSGAAITAFDGALVRAERVSVLRAEGAAVDAERAELRVEELFVREVRACAADEGEAPGRAVSSRRGGVVRVSHGVFDEARYAVTLSGGRASLDHVVLGGAHGALLCSGDPSSLTLDHVTGAQGGAAERSTAVVPDAPRGLAR